MKLTDKQWIKIEPVILQSMRKKDSRGRKPRDPREVLNGIVWVLRTGAPWKGQTDIRRSRQTCPGDSSIGGRQGCFVALSRYWRQIYRNAATLTSGKGKHSS